jgi:hypothetical protein
MAATRPLKSIYPIFWTVCDCDEVARRKIKEQTANIFTMFFIFVV